MNKIWKIGLIPLSLLIVTQMYGCSIYKKEVALITDVGDIDDGSFNQASWEAISEYCKANNKTYDYYRPFADSDFARKCAIKQAVYKGAKIILLPGYKFEESVTQCQMDYPDVHFIIVDGETHNDVQPNTVCVRYNPEVSGFLAGYAIANDYLRIDFTQKGYLEDTYGYGYCGGMASDGVLQFGFGFIQGVICSTEYFCSKNHLDQPNLDFNYNYAGVYAQDDNAAMRMKGWYANGTKVVFSCGGKLYQSIVEGVKDFNKKNNLYDWPEGSAPRNAARWVGVDTDQYTGLEDEHAKKTLYTSALKNLGETFKTALNYHFSDNWDIVSGPVKVDETGKQTQKFWRLGLNSIFGRPEKAKEGVIVTERDYVGMPEVHDEKTGIMRGFTNFSFDDYNHLLTKCKTGEEGEKYFVYPNDGLDLLDERGNPKPAPGKGDPTFMGVIKEGEKIIRSSNDYYIIPENSKNASAVSFNNYYFKGYDPSKIIVHYVN